MKTEKLNDAPVLGRMDGRYQTLLMAVLHKLSPGKPVTLSADDFIKLSGDHNGTPVLFVHAHPDSLSLTVVKKDRADAIAAYEKNMTPETKQ